MEFLTKNTSQRLTVPSNFLFNNLTLNFFLLVNGLCQLTLYFKSHIFCLSKQINIFQLCVLNLFQNSLVNDFFFIFKLYSKRTVVQKQPSFKIWCSSKYVFLNILQYSQENTCAGVCFNKVAGLQLLKRKRFQNRCFPVNIAKFLIKAFVQNTSGSRFQQLVAHKSILCQVIRSTTNINNSKLLLLIIVLFNETIPLNYHYDNWEDAQEEILADNCFSVSFS